MPQLPASDAATSSASKPAPSAIYRGQVSRSRMIANGSGGGVLPARFHAAAAVCVGCRRAKRVPSHPFSQRMIAVAVKTAKNTTALGPNLVKKNREKPIKGKPSQNNPKHPRHGDTDR